MADGRGPQRPAEGTVGHSDRRRALDVGALVDAVADTIAAKVAARLQFAENDHVDQRRPPPLKRMRVAFRDGRVKLTFTPASVA